MVGSCLYNNIFFTFFTEGLMIVNFGGYVDCQGQGMHMPKTFLNVQIHLKTVSSRNDLYAV